jgi:hypothetical protein
MAKQLYARTNDKRIVLCHFNPTFDGRALLDELKRENNKSTCLEAWEYLGLSSDDSVLHSSRFPAEHIDRKRLVTRTIPYAVVWAPKVGDKDWFKKLVEDGYNGIRVLLYSEQTLGYCVNASDYIKYPREELTVRFSPVSLASLVNSAIL